MAESSTCPQCRIKVTSKGVVAKLFFCFPDAHESIVKDGDQSLKAAAAEIKRINEELSSARVSLTERAHELAKLAAEKRALEQKSTQLTESLR